MEKIIGQIIKERLEAQKMEVTEFAKRINRERSNIYNIFQRDSIDTNLLKIIGQVLEYDFFQHLIEPETIEKLKVIEITRKSKVLLEIDLSEDEIMKIGFEDRVFKILNKQL